jgi:hypothetical protein
MQRAKYWGWRHKLVTDKLKDALRVALTFNDLNFAL